MHVIYSGTNFPEMWVSANPTEFENNTEHSKTKVITAFVHNRHADVLSGLGEDLAVQEFLGLLDRIFRRKDKKTNATDGTSSDVGLATESFVKGGMVDWSQEPYIEGGCGFLTYC